MCGRYTQGRAIPNLIERYAALGLDNLSEEQGFAPRYNIAPGQLAGVIFQGSGARQAAAMRWGLVPHWAKSLEGLKHKPINAKSETADTGAFFRDAFKSRRCLVPATGFFEWKGARPPKQPFYIHPTDQEIFSFAGLWSRWNAPGGEAMETFTILTTAANAYMEKIHHRMPCILRPEDEAAWLDNEVTDIAAAKALLTQYPSEKLATHPVSTAVNKVTNEGEALVRPVAIVGDNDAPEGQLSLFGEGD